jgi:hypothetical protein
MINMRRTLGELYDSGKISEDLYNEELKILGKDL